MEYDTEKHEDQLVIFDYIFDFVILRAFGTN